VTAGGSPVTSPSTALKLDGTWGGATHVLSTASPKDGSARFAYHLPAGAKGKIVLRVSGAATSAPVTVAVS
jgi:hypothetical protein